MATTIVRPDVQPQPSVEVRQPKDRMWLLLAAVVVAIAILAIQALGASAPDGSHEAVEFARQSALVSSDDSHLVAESARHEALGAVVDVSHEYAESSRFARLAPVADDSFDRNEANRHENLGG